MHMARRSIAFVTVTILTAVACSRSDGPPRAVSTGSPGPERTSRPAIADSTVRAMDLPMTGDFDSIRARRLLRVLVVPGRTQFFIDLGTPRGLAVDMSAMLEKHLDAKYHLGTAGIHVVLIPVTPDQIIPALLSGRADMAAAGLTVTAERLAQVDFSDPTFTNVSEIVVTGPASPPLTSIDDLSGKEVFVRPGMVYYETVESLNASFRKRGLAPIRIRDADESLEEEDILEMVNAGLVPLVVVNDYLATFWKQVFPQIKPRPDLALRTDGDIAWMIRKQSPQLKAELNEFLTTVASGSAARNMLLQEYLKSTRFVESATSPAEARKFRQTVEMFRKYGAQYDLDYLLMMAQGYQESRLDQQARSAVGAVGVMQVMPATGRSLGVGDIHQVEPNIHAGVKYVRSIIDQHFTDDSVNALNRTLFAFAAYNAGPARVTELRRKAAQRGLDPNVWDNNVELVAAQDIGRETVSYVANIFKYYIAYKLMMDRAAEHAAAIKAH
jgi:membrane-bound lytic murein transglycosylase MltF